MNRRWTRDAELPREIALGRQAGAGRKLAAFDQSANLIGDLPVKTPRFDTMERHLAARVVVWTAIRADSVSSAAPVEHATLPAFGKLVKWYDQLSND